MSVWDEFLQEHLIRFSHGLGSISVTLLINLHWDSLSSLRHSSSRLLQQSFTSLPSCCQMLHVSSSWLSCSTYLFFYNRVSPSVFHTGCSHSNPINIAELTMTLSGCTSHFTTLTISTLLPSLIWDVSIANASLYSWQIMVPFYTGCGPVLSTHFFFATTIRALRLSHFTSDASAVYCLLSLSFLLYPRWTISFFLILGSTGPTSWWYFLLLAPCSEFPCFHWLSLSFSPPKKIMDSFCFPFLLLRGLWAPFIPFCSCALQCLLAHCSVHFSFLLRGGLRVPFLFFV